MNSGLEAKVGALQRRLTASKPAPAPAPVPEKIETIIKVDRPAEKPQTLIKTETREKSRNVVDAAPKPTLVETVQAHRAATKRSVEPQSIVQEMSPEGGKRKKIEESSSEPQAKMTETKEIEVKKFNNPFEKNRTVRPLGVHNGAVEGKKSIPRAEREKENQEGCAQQ